MLIFNKIQDGDVRCCDDLMWNAPKEVLDTCTDLKFNLIKKI